MYNESIGHILSEARHRAGKSIKEVEFDTKIRAKFIESLEKDDFDNLPSSIYTQGFIKTYANYLGIDHIPLIQQYRGLYAYKDESDLSSLSSNIRVKSKKRPAWFKPAVGIGAIAVLFISLIVWGAYQQFVSKEPKMVVQEVKTKKTVPTTVAATTVTTQAPAKLGVNDGKLDVIIKVTGIGDTGSWTKAFVDDKKAFEGIIHKGETKQFKGDSSVRLRIGNVTNVEIIYNGKKITSADYKTVNGIFDQTFTADKTSGKTTTTRGSSSTEKTSSTITAKTTSKTTTTTKP
ncbi:MAG: DUF4115 domain-containing protein [Firmicutes bacterium]|nr:DUF4115 domain-containing protein [Bacillota bacterium]